VPKGTVVLAGSVRFATQSDLNVGGTIFSGPQPRISMQRVPVQALNGGSDGNVARYQINKIEGSPASQLDVQNDAPTRGGSDKTVAFVTADDRRKLQEALTRTVTDRLNQQLKSQLPTAKETAVAWNAQNPAIVEMTFSKNEGDEAPTLSLTMKVRYSATAFNNDAYNAFVKQMTAAKGGEAMPGFDVDQASVAAPPPEVQGVESGVIRLQAHARASAAAHLDAVTLRAAVVNQPLAQAQAYLSAVPGVTRADVQAWPAWLGRTPLLGWRVSVRVAP